MTKPLQAAAVMLTSVLILSNLVGCSTTESTNASDESGETSTEGVVEPPRASTEDEPEPSEEATSPDDPADEEAPDEEEAEAPDEVDETRQRATEVIEEEFSDHFRISTSAHIEGWTFFQVADERQSHPRPRCVVVREDATRVEGDESEELLKIYEAMGVFDDPLPSAYDMAVAANALVGDCRNVAQSDTAERRDGDFDDLHVTAPTAERDDDTVTLSYFATGHDYRDESIYRGEVQFTADEIIATGVEEFIPEDADTVDPFQ